MGVVFAVIISVLLCLCRRVFDVRSFLFCSPGVFFFVYRSVERLTKIPHRRTWLPMTSLIRR